MDAATTLPLQRRVNAELVIQELRSSGPMRVTELMESTGLSRPTIESIADDFVRAGWLTEAMFEPGQRRGRPARELSFRADGGVVLGVDIGVRRATAILADVSGDVLSETTLDLPVGLSAAERVARVLSLAAECLKGAGVVRKALMRAVVGTPGVVDIRTGTVTQCAIIPGWSGLDLGSALQQSLTCPVEVDNDANLAAIGERWRGVAVGVQDMVFVLAGERLGAGIVVGETVVRGYIGGAGEMGFTSLFDTDPGSEGIGALARHAGGEALKRLLQAESYGHESGMLLRAMAADDPERVNAEVLLDAARLGDAMAIELLEGILARVARSVAVLASLLNPEMIVIGGAVANAAEQILEPLRRTLGEMTLLPTRVEASTLGHRAVALGAVRQAALRAQDDLLSRPAPR